MDANLKIPISDIEVSDDFRTMCEYNGFKTLGDIVKYRVSELLEKPGFRMRVLEELIKIIRQYGLDQYLKD